MFEENFVELSKGPTRKIQWIRSASRNLANLLYCQCGAAPIEELLMLQRVIFVTIGARNPNQRNV